MSSQQVQHGKSNGGVAAQRVKFVLNKKTRIASVTDFHDCCCKLLSLFPQLNVNGDSGQGVQLQLSYIDPEGDCIVFNSNEEFEEAKIIMAGTGKALKIFVQEITSSPKPSQPVAVNVAAVAAVASGSETDGRVGGDDDDDDDVTTVLHDEDEGEEEDVKNDDESVEMDDVDDDDGDDQGEMFLLAEAFLKDDDVRTVLPEAVQMVAQMLMQRMQEEGGATDGNDGGSGVLAQVLEAYPVIAQHGFIERIRPKLERAVDRVLCIINAGSPTSESPFPFPFPLSVPFMKHWLGMACTMAPVFVPRIIDVALQWLQARRESGGAEFHHRKHRRGCGRGRGHRGHRGHRGGRGRHHHGGCHGRGRGPMPFWLMKWCTPFFSDEEEYAQQEQATQSRRWRHGHGCHGGKHRGGWKWQELNEEQLAEKFEHKLSKMERKMQGHKNVHARGNGRGRAPKAELVVGDGEGKVVSVQALAGQSTTIIKSWSMKNSDTEKSWPEGCALVPVRGHTSMAKDASFPVPSAGAGQTVSIAAIIETPKEPGKHRVYFRLREPNTASRNGRRFGPPLCVEVCVAADSDAKNNGEENKETQGGGRWAQEVEQLQAMGFPQDWAVLERAVDVADGDLLTAIQVLTQ